MHIPIQWYVRVGEKRVNPRELKSSARLGGMRVASIINYFNGERVVSSL